MEINFHAVDFAVVGSDQQKYYEEKTIHLFNTQKELRRLFIGISDIILRRGSDFLVDVVGNKPLPEFQDFLFKFEYPKSYFKEVLMKLRFLLEEIQDDWLFDDSVDASLTMPLYRNIKHMIVTMAYQASIKGFGY